MSKSPKQMMEIEIKFAKGKVDFVIVHHGDDPDFVGKHNLKPASVQIIAQYIDQTIRDFLQNNPESSQNDQNSNDNEEEKEEEQPSEEPWRESADSNYSQSQSNTVDRQSSANHSDYFHNSAATDRIPPPSPAVTHKMRLADPSQSIRNPPSKTNSNRSIADDESNDTTVPTHILNREAMEQTGFGNSLASVSDSSSQYYHRTPSAKFANATLSATNPVRNSPSVEYRKIRQDDDDNNTITELVEKSLFPLESGSIRSRSGSRSVLMKKDDSGRVSAYAESDIPTPLVHTRHDGVADVHQPEEEPSHSDQPRLEQSMHATSPRISDNYDEYTYRSDLMSLVTADQESLANKTEDSSQPEDPESKFNRLKQATLKKSYSTLTNNNNASFMVKSTINPNIKSNLKPAAKSLQMGKQKLNTNQGNKKNESPTRQREKEKFVGKTVNERLYHNAELMKKKKDYLHQKNEEKKYQQIQSEKFRLNEVSQRIVENLTLGRTNPDDDSQATGRSDIGQKLYQEGIATIQNRKKRAEKVEKAKEQSIEDWSCVKCGTFHKIPLSKLSVDTPLMWDANEGQRYLCSKCGFNNQNKVESFRPTNVGLLYNEEVKEAVQTKLQNDRAASTNIHDHLYQSGKQHEQTLQLNRALWEDIQAKMSFKPTISEKSQAIIEAYKHNRIPSDDRFESGLRLEEEDDNSDPYLRHQKNLITGPAMKEYFSRPTFDRLIHTTTRSYVDNTIHQQKQPKSLLPKPSTFADSKASSSVYTDKTHQEEFVNRLVYEYKDLDERKQQRTNQYYTIDEKTGQKMFQPKVPELPEEIFPGAVRIQVSSNSNDSKRDIWNDILRRDQELMKEKLKRQQQAIEKTLADIQKNQVKALSSSNDILQSSTQKNLEDLFKLLLVSTHPSNEELGKEEGEGGVDPAISNDATSSIATISVTEGGDISKAEPAAASRYTAFLRKDVKIGDENSSHLSSSVTQFGDNNTIISERQINDVLTHHLKDWRSKSLDLLLIKPYLLINEISTLLLDMKQQVFEKWLHKQRLQQLNTKITPSTSPIKTEEVGKPDCEIEKAAPEQLLVSFEEFTKLALKCIRHRNGPGKGYIFAPKKKAELAIQMKLQEYSEETFHPEIDKVSEAIIQKHLRETIADPKSMVPIEEVLVADGQRVQQKIEQLRKEKQAKEEKELTFKPQLYKPPSYVVPRYRGLDLSDLQEEEEEGEGEEGERGYGDESMTQPLSVGSGKPGVSSVYDIPNIAIASKGSGATNSNTIRGGPAIRGGGTTKKDIESVTLTSKSTSPVAKSLSASGSGGDLTKTLLKSPTAGKNNKTGSETLLTPSHVRQSRLLDQQSDFPPPPTPTSQSKQQSLIPSANLTVVTTNIMGPPPRNPTHITLTSDSASTMQNVYYEEDDPPSSKQPKDDLSLLSPNVPRGESDRVAGKYQTPERKGDLHPSPQKRHHSHHHPHYRISGHPTRLDSSSQESYSPPMSVSSASHNSEKHSIEFPSKFSAVSDVSHSQHLNSSTEYDDIPTPAIVKRDYGELPSRQYQQHMMAIAMNQQKQGIGAMVSPPLAPPPLPIESVTMRKPNVLVNQNQTVGADSSSEYSNSTNNSQPRGYGNRSNPSGKVGTAVTNDRRGSTTSRASNGSSGGGGGYASQYLKSMGGKGATKSLPLLPHELAKQQNRTKGDQRDHYFENESMASESTLSTQSTVIKEKKKIR